MVILSLCIIPNPPPLLPSMCGCDKILYTGGGISLVTMSVSFFLIHVSVIAQMSMFLSTIYCWKVCILFTIDLALMWANYIPIEFTCLVRFTVIKFFEDMHFSCVLLSGALVTIMYSVKEIPTCPRLPLEVSHRCSPYPQHYNPCSSSIGNIEMFIVGPSLFLNFPQKVWWILYYPQ